MRELNNLRQRQELSFPLDFCEIIALLVSSRRRTCVFWRTGPMNNIQSELKLRDLGERRILREIIYPRFSSFDGQIVGIGDDCAILPSPPIGHALVVTTDPCPTPVVCMVERPDMYHYGRMTILINVSDLAAMGAQPLGIVVSTVMPEDMSVREFDRFLDGI